MRREFVSRLLSSLDKCKQGHKLNTKALDYSLMVSDKLTPFVTWWCRAFIVGSLLSYSGNIFFFNPAFLTRKLSVKNPVYLGLKILNSFFKVAWEVLKFCSVYVQCLLKKKLSWALPQIMGASGSINCPYSLNFSPSDNEPFQPSARETIVPGKHKVSQVAILVS